MFKRDLFLFSLAVSINLFAGCTTRPFDWHVEVPARPRNQKIGSP